MYGVAARISMTMKKGILLIALLIALIPEVRAQGGRGFWHQEWEVEKTVTRFRWCMSCRSTSSAARST